MPIPILTSIQDWKVSINPDFVDFNEYKNWSPERQIEVFWKLVKKYVYWNSTLPEQKIDKSMQAFNWAYWLAKLKFQNIKRNTGWRYFDHLIRVMQYLIISSKNPSIKKTIIAICHDIIEDTDITFTTLKEIFWSHIALWVLIISKNPTKWFIGDRNDYDLFKIIDESWILNSKWLIWDEYLQRKTYYPESITDEERFLETTYKKLERKYKQKVSLEYFSHILAEDWDVFNEVEDKINALTPCLNKFYNHALLLAYRSEFRVKLTKDEIKGICMESLEVKFWDRIDNLRTTEIYENLDEVNINKAKRKIYETKTYFYKIVKEFDFIEWTDLYSIMSWEVQKLEEFIVSDKVRTVLLESREQVWKLLK